MKISTILLLLLSLSITYASDPNELIKLGLENKSNTELARSYFLDAKKHLEDNRESKEYSKVLIYLSILEYRSNNFRKSASYLYNAEYYINEKNYESLKYLLYQNLGVLNYSVSKYHESLKYYSVSEKYTDTPNKIESLMYNKCQIYYKLKKWDSFKKNINNFEIDSDYYTRALSLMINYNIDIGDLNSADSLINSHSSLESDFLFSKLRYYGVTGNNSFFKVKNEIQSLYIDNHTNASIALFECEYLININQVDLAKIPLKIAKTYFQSKAITERYRECLLFDLQINKDRSALNALDSISLDKSNLLADLNLEKERINEQHLKAKQEKETFKIIAIAGVILAVVILLSAFVIVRLKNNVIRATKQMMVREKELNLLYKEINLNVTEVINELNFHIVTYGYSDDEKLIEILKNLSRDINGIKELESKD